MTNSMFNFLYMILQESGFYISYTDPRRFFKDLFILQENCTDQPKICIRMLNPVCYKILYRKLNMELVIKMYEFQYSTNEYSSNLLKTTITKIMAFKCVFTDFINLKLRRDHCSRVLIRPQAG